jgi:hypothetical protein
MMKLDAYLALITVVTISVHVAAWIWVHCLAVRRGPCDAREDAPAIPSVQPGRR